MIETIVILLIDLNHGKPIIMTGSKVAAKFEKKKRNPNSEKSKYLFNRIDGVFVELYHSVIYSLNEK